MNKARRAKLQEALAIVEEMRDEEQSAFDNLPESIQSSERGEAMSEAVEALNEAADNITTFGEA